MYYIGPIIVAYCVDNVLIFQGNLCWYCLVWPCSQAQEKGVYNKLPFLLGPGNEAMSGWSYGGQDYRVIFHVVS